MKRAIWLLIIGLLLLSSLTACWNRREVTDLAIIVALGVDKNEEGQIMITLQLLNPNEVTALDGGGGGYDSPVTTYSGSGDMLFEALRKVTKQVPRKIYLAHLRFVIFGEEYAKEGIYDSLDFLSRDHKMRTDFYIGVAKDKTANEVLKTLTSIEKIPAEKMFFSLESAAENWAATRKVRLNHLIDDILIDGINPVLTGITTKENAGNGDDFDNVQTVSPSATLMFSDLAVFRKSQLIGWLSEEDSKGFNYIKGDVESTVIVTNCEKGHAGVELIHMNSKLKTRIENSQPVFSIEIEGEGKLAEVTCNLEAQDPSAIASLEEKVNERIEQTIRAVIIKAQKELKNDFIGLGKQFYKDLPKEWQHYEENWAGEFEQVKVEINSNIKIREVGTISNPFFNQLKEE